MSWKKFNQKPEIKKMLDEINEQIEKEENEGIVVVPLKELRFRAFELTKLKDIKCIIIGLDPYKHINQACGISFSVPHGIDIPPSLNNIFKELNTDLNIPIPTSGDLTSWTQQGVLMLNAYLTLQEGKTCSHKHLWSKYTNELLKYIVRKNNCFVVICFGNDALNIVRDIEFRENQIIISGAHPSPLSANKGGFFGKKYFSRVNEYLKKHGVEEIDWNL